eukprot:gb/GFBE01020313.1/.p1 GENE.gb/GFBE01020313.1/~~gb/GFBE01020313.1/.p1  ORF type:complete len:269 (+),score=43.31 gb/GFBE01020313.1/:1-807(+)
MQSTPVSVSSGESVKVEGINCIMPASATATLTTDSTREPDEEKGNLPQAAQDGSNQDESHIVESHKETTSQESLAARLRRSCCSRRGLCLNACALVVVLLTTCAALLWPRDPTWKITKLDLDANAFVAAMLPGGNPTPLNLTADVGFDNPNFVGTTTEPSTFKVHLSSGVLMAHGDTSVCTVGPRASSSLRAYVTVPFNEVLTQKITEEVMANAGLLKVTAEVQTLAHVMGLRVRVTTRCALTSDTMKVLSTPEETLVEKHCTYSYSL